MPPRGWISPHSGYEAAHQRIKRWRGAAKELQCVNCLEPASDWAYSGLCPNERVEQVRAYLLAYSDDPEQYEPMCRQCHMRKDVGRPNGKCQFDHLVEGDNAYVRPDGLGIECLTCRRYSAKMYARSKRANNR